MDACSALHRILAICAALLTAACTASAAGPVKVALGGRPVATLGKPWTAKLTIRPASFRGEVRLTAVGPGRLSVRAARSGGAYRIRFVFPATGRWSLTARAGGSTSKLGSVTVRKPPPLTFAWPTSVDLQPDGSLLVVENGLGRIVLVQPSSGAVRVLASGLAKAFAAVRAPSGSVFISDGRSLKRLDGTDAPVEVDSTAEDIGPLAIAPDGTVFYATGTRLFRLRTGGSPQPLTTGLNGPHGLAVAADGHVLVADTSNDRVLRVDPVSGATSTLFRTGQPRGIDVAPDGTIYVVEAGTKRVGRYNPAGARLGDVGPPFADPFDVIAGPAGSVYVVDTAAAGQIRRIAADGKVSSVP